MKFSVQVIVHPDDDTEASPVAGKCSPWTATTWRRTLSACSSPRQRTSWRRCRTSWWTAGQRRDRQAGGLPGLRTGAPAQGRADDRGAQLVRRAAAGEPPLVALRLPDRPAGPSSRWPSCCPSGPPRTGLPAGPLRRPGLLRHHRRPAGRAAAAGQRLHPAGVRRQTHAVADRLEEELGEERRSFIDGCQRDREELPRPDLPIVVGLDGGYVHSSQQRSRTDGWFEVIAGKAIPADGRTAASGTCRPTTPNPNGAC